MNPSNKSILALDVGDVRIGVAIASEIARLPHPLTTLQNNSSIAEALSQIVSQEQISKLVVGLPRNMAGEETAQTKKVRAFAEELADKLNLPLYFIDETLTSVEAENYLRARGKVYTKADIDAAAATLILEEFLNGQSQEPAVKI